MTAPRVTVTAHGTVKILPPADFSLDELVEAVEELQSTREALSDLWDNRLGSGPDLTEADNVVESRSADVSDEITWEMSAVEAEAFLRELRQAAMSAARLRIDRHSADCPVCKAERSAS